MIAVAARFTPHKADAGAAVLPAHQLAGVRKRDAGYSSRRAPLRQPSHLRKFFFHSRSNCCTSRDSILLAASLTGAFELPVYVPISHEARYFSCSFVSLSISTPMPASLRRAISLSMAGGTG